MDTLGQPARQVLQHAKPSQTTPSKKLVKHTRLDPGELPPIFDQTVDRKSQALVCFRQNNGAIELRRPLSAEERATIEARKTALGLVIEPYGPDDRTDLEACLGTMFAGFRAMRQQGDTVATTVMITLAVLREFPAWAIQVACGKAAAGVINPHWPPNDAELATVVRALVQPYRDAHDRARRLLEAKVA
jgi:hypothetical protein